MKLVYILLGGLALGTGAYCALTFAACFMDGGRHPVLLPASLLAGALCALGAVGGLWGLMKSCRARLLSLLAVAVLAGGFFLLWMYLGR